MRRLVRFEEFVLILFAIAFLIIMAATRHFQFTSYYHPRFVQCLAALAIAVSIRAYLKERRWLRPLLSVARDFAPFFGVLLLYETLHDLTPLLRPEPVDAALIRIDRAALGVDAAYWLGQRATPWLTRVMVWCYASYFVAPPLLGAAIYW